MKTLITVILFLSLTSPVHAEWTKKDTAFQLTYTAVHLADWGQTLDIARNPDSYYEINPIVGKHPSVGRVNTYMALSLIVHTGISYLLPSKYRRWWQIGTIGVTTSLVIHNNSVGLKVRFKK